MRSEEQLKLAYDTHMEEFKFIREEINANIESSRQTLTITLTAMGILIGASPFIIDSRIPVLFLVASLPFYIISWVQVRYIFFQNNLGDYLEQNLIPNIRNSISNINPSANFDVSYILGWQSQWRKRYQSLLLLPATIAYFAVPLLAATLSLSAYFIFNTQLQMPLTIIEYLLIGINIAFFLYSIILGFWTYRRFRPNRR